MEQVEEDSIEDSQFLLWYVDMIEKFPNKFVHYLSNDALLYWFGRSIKGPNNILFFIKSNMKDSKHILDISNPNNNLLDHMSVKSTLVKNEINTTPESNVSSVNIDVKDEFAGGDGYHIDKLFVKNNSNDTINYFKTTGFLEFSAPCKDGSNWQRPYTLIVKYTGCVSNPVQFSINSISYEDNSACRRNLFSEFEKCASEIE